MITGDIRDEWRINAIERKVDSLPQSYEVHSLRSDVDSLERTVRELRSEINELRSQLSNIQDYTIHQMREELAQLQEASK